ncbi:acyltransferase family protein [Flavisphingomonas formosensis]|uniref:acyltransferase family protein n=1 Tax=Flavisphingomonas formosensis TaxID=861534 RepID=UPI0012FAD666|nr:acyltransferase [Sphingomonas formosensis]
MSDTIRFARVACIILMMFTHVRPYPAFWYMPRFGWWDYGWHWVYAFFSLYVGKASVPLLGLISGWLLGMQYKAPWWSVARKKARTILLPLFIWNAVLLFVMMSLPWFEPTWPRPTDAIGWFYKFFPLRDYPTNSPLYFMRDLFLCMLLAPALLWLFDRWGTRAMIAVFAVVLIFAAIADEGTILTRPVILPTFVTGLVLARRAIDVRAPRFFNHWGALAAGTWLLIELPTLVPVYRLYFTWLPIAGHVPEIITRYALAYLLWWWVAHVALKPFGRQVARLEPYIFFIFCTHHIVYLALATEFDGRGVRNAIAPIYPLYFFLQPLIAVCVGFAFYKLMSLISPSLLGWVTGGRVAGRDKARAAHAPAPEGGAALKRS